MAAEAVDREKFRKILKDKGFKLTRQRLVVLEALAENPGQHFTAEEIYEKVKADNPDIGLATVYRTVQLLVELELIDRVNLDDGYVRYEIGDALQKEHHRHNHLICLKCGKIQEVRTDMLAALEKRAMDSLGFQVTDHEVILYGYCRDCLNENNKNQEETD